MPYAVFDQTVPNPQDKNVDAAFEVYKKEKCDSLITLGGGSSHDCGKGVGFLAGNGGRIHDYEGVDKSTKPFPPLCGREHHCRNGFGNDALLHHYRYLPQGENVHRRLALHPQRRH